LSDFGDGRFRPCGSWGSAARPSRL